MEVGNIAKAAAFKRFFHLSHKNTHLLFLNIFHEKNINRWVLWVTQKYEMQVSFKSTYFEEHLWTAASEKPNFPSSEYLNH